MIRAENDEASLRFSYDRLGRLRQAENETFGRATTYEYDPVGNRISVTYQGSGRTSSYRYGSRNELLSLTDPDGRTTTFGYDEEVREISRTLPNGIRTKRRYDPVGRLVSVATRGRDETFAGRGYAYNRAGQVVARVDERGAIRSYRYDDALPRPPQIHKC